MISRLARKSSIFWVYLVGFLIAFHTALPTYINSSFLSQYIKEDIVGLIYVAGSILTIILFLIFPKLLKRYGNYKTALFLIILQSVLLFGLAFIEKAIWIIPLFILNLVCIPLIYCCTDIFLEHLSTNKETGLVRGIYLTAVNLAWAASPLISSLILSSNSYSKVYLLSFVFLIPVILIILNDLKENKDYKYPHTDIFTTIKRIWRDINIRNIFLANLALFFFYSWMTIYTPLYLNQNIGLSWSEIGIVFTVMLLPFVIFQLPLGRLADKFFGEKEILTLGFLIMAFSTGLITFINDKNLVLWAVILFVTRVGACAVEIMCDTYFFKKVDGRDTNLISFYRMSSPVDYITGPAIATLILSFHLVQLKYLFLILGILMISGLRFALRLKDTK